MRRDRRSRDHFSFTDLIGEAVALLGMEAVLDDFALLTHPHPTMIEALVEASFKGLGKPIHTF